ncbi:MAG: IS1096 element passenger TnpR family protein [Bacteroidales bacterium]
MHIYKFRMLYGENEDFVRDFELKATQNFEDFHKLIAESVDLNPEELSSFHICDQKWNKKTEITLIDMLEGEDAEPKNSTVQETYVMHNALIRDFINEPRQRLLYEHDFLNMKTFFIELLSVYKIKEDGIYPRCTFKRGTVSDLQDEVNMIEEDDEELRKQLIQDFEDIVDGTLDDYYQID